MAGDSTMPDARDTSDELLILFPRGSRPNVEDLRKACRNGELADADGPELPVTARSDRVVAISPPSGIALQRSGLVFDLVGLAPGPAVPIPEIGQIPTRVASAGAHEPTLPTRTQASSLRLGPHIAAGGGDLSILREWFGLAQGIAARFGASSVCWVPGALVLPLERLGEALAAWDARGGVPVGILASFRRTLDGAIQSQGLGFFTGQEFRIEPQLVRGGEDALARVIFTHLFYAGRQERSGELASPDGYPLRIEPSANGRFVRVWPG